MKTTVKATMKLIGNGPLAKTVWKAGCIPALNQLTLLLKNIDDSYGNPEVDSIEMIEFKNFITQEFVSDKIDELIMQIKKHYRQCEKQDIKDSVEKE